MKESIVRDFITDNFSSFTSCITNYFQFSNDLIVEQENIIKGGSVPTKILISDLVKLTLIDNLKQALPVLANLKLLDKEFKLLKTESGRGKQPSIDIMAYNPESYCLALIELKISDSAEREAVTELSAYNQGLQNKFRGLSSLEVLWIPISTEWRITTKSAIEFVMLWQNTLAMPLKMDINYNKALNQVTNVDLQCFNPTSDLTEIECLNLFSYECFEAFDYCTMQDIPNKEAFINYVTTICIRQKINGFIIFHKPVNMMYPYGFTLCIYNPYKGYLHKKISQDFIKENGEQEFYSIFKESDVINTNYIDIDFRTEKIKSFEPNDDDMEGTSLKCDTFWKKNFLSVGDFAESAENSNIHFLVEKIMQTVDSNGTNSRAFGTPDFEGLLKKLADNTVDSVMYLGVHLELISKKIIVEHQRELHDDDFFETAASFPYLKKTFKDYNLK
jgi:hypothetical protein